jgi:hypothetical protein
MLRPRLLTLDHQASSGGAGLFVTAQQPHGTGRDDLGALPALGRGAEYGQALDDAEACCGLSYVPCGTPH